MREQVQTALFWLGLAGAVGVPAGLIASKQALLHNGRTVLLPLAPVDPRSLMQGDYMDLRYALAMDALQQSDTGPAWPERGAFRVRLDGDGVGTLVGLDKGAPLGPDEVRLKYRNVHSTPHIGAESYFFQEGQRAQFDHAAYGELRVGEDGTALLVGLRDRNRVAM